MAGQQDQEAQGLTAAADGRGHRLTRDFFDRPVLEVAPELLGCLVTHEGVTVRLTEVEAYDGERDPGSHAYRGPTPRTRVMFGAPGGLYVYFSYGMHYCCNLVCGEEGRASAVLLRAGEVVDGLELARERRGDPPERNLARGPACLTQALAIGRDDNGLDVVAPDSPMPIRHPAPDAHPLPSIATGPRVGVAGAGGDGTAYPWRFWLEGDPTVSAYRPGGQRKPRRTATRR